MYLYALNLIMVVTESDFINILLRHANTLSCMNNIMGGKNMYS